MDRKMSRLNFGDDQKTLQILDIMDIKVYR